MIAPGIDCFHDIRSDPAVRAQLDAFRKNRVIAMLRFVLAILGTAALTGTIWWLLNPGPGTAIFLILLGAIGVLAAFAFPWRVAEDLKVPVMQALAVKAGVDYQEDDFTPLGYSETRELLFGRVDNEVFSDLFRDKDADGRSFAVYEGSLRRGFGRTSVSIFRCQIYAIERRPSASDAAILIGPDRGLFNSKPIPGAKAVEIGYDPEFEKKFEAYSTNEAEARQLLFNSGLRRCLLDLERKGRAYVAVGPAYAMVVVHGRDRFEPGSMFRPRAGEDYVRAMIADVCGALATLGTLKAALE